MSKRSIEVNEEQDRVVSAKTESHSVPAIPASEEQDAPMNDLEEQLSDEFDSDGEIIEIDGDDEINDEDDLRKSKKKLKL
ncbi:Ribosome assembly protein rrb1 [Fusarium falciforme]|nr:Ribosome assembly protein rrb1 [Fusarium falciforme]